MPGILVGVDGSVHSCRALEWAVSEAAIRCTPLTVLTVQQAVAGYWGPAVYPQDLDLAEHSAKIAQEETDKVLDKLGAGQRPLSVTVRAVTGVPGNEILKAADDADMIVV